MCVYIYIYIYIYLHKYICIYIYPRTPKYKIDEYLVESVVLWRGLTSSIRNYLTCGTEYFKYNRVEGVDSEEMCRASSCLRLRAGSPLKGVL